MWLVIENTPGYMPDSEPAAFTNRKEAASYAYSLAKDLRDQGYKVIGSDGFYDATLHANDLGRVITTEWSNE